MKLFATISKVDENGDGTIDVHGIASTEAKDSQGETVTKGAMQDAIPEYLLHGGTGPLRAMHQPIAAGYVYKAEVNANGDTEISAKVVDPVEVLKVTSGVYKGFSIGGKKVPGGYDAATKTITKMKLTEISLVDRPANPEATISMWKGDDMEPTQTDEKQIDVTINKDAVASVDALAEIMNKGEISPQRLVELANAEIAKSKAPAKEEVKIEKKEFTVDEINKGMYSVSDLASVLRNINYLASDALYETKSEGDNSAVPGKLVEWLKTGAEIFKEMADEELQEMIDNLDAMVSANPVVIQMSEKIGEIKKAFGEEKLSVRKAYSIAASFLSEEEIDQIASTVTKQDEVVDALQSASIIKAGARNSAQDKKRIQAMHDMSTELGADCGMTKHDHSIEIMKACSNAGLAEGGVATEFITKLAADNETLTKRVKELESMPAPAKAALRVITKSDDIVDVTKTEATGPILKADGTVDQEATILSEIKKVHQSGGIPLFQKR